MQNALRSTRITLEMIKWEHSIFALPFALTAAMLAAGGWPRPAQLGWIVLAMVAARSAAMAFNRLADAEIDARNPRTATRAIPAGHLSRRFVLGTIAAAGIVVVGALLAYEHSLVSAKDLSKLNAAFFATNGVVSVVFFLFVAADLLLRR